MKCSICHHKRHYHCEVCNRYVCGDCLEIIKVRLANYSKSRGDCVLRYFVTSTAIRICKQCMDAISDRAVGDADMFKNLSKSFFQNKIALEELQK